MIFSYFFRNSLLLEVEPRRSSITMRNNPAHLAFIVVSPILSAIFALINTLTIYVFFRKFLVTTMSLLTIVNICACDIFVCLICNTFYVANISHPSYSWTTGYTSCKMFKFFTMVTNVAQIYLLCFLNADRLRRLTKSTESQWQKKHGQICITIAWMAAIALCVPRLLLFDVKEIKQFSPKFNTNIIIDYNCKPVGLSQSANTINSIGTFIFAYVIPASFILYTITNAQLFMWKRRKRIHLSNNENAVLKMSSKLAITFNPTATLFMCVWTPFFVISLVDLRFGPTQSALYSNTNFSLRCTFLILGSGKPLIYFACLDKFRNSFRRGFTDDKSTSGDTSITNTNSRETIHIKSIGVSEYKISDTFPKKNTQLNF